MLSQNFFSGEGGYPIIWWRRGRLSQDLLLEEGGGGCPWICFGRGAIPASHYEITRSPKQSVIGAWM